MKIGFNSSTTLKIEWVARPDTFKTYEGLQSWEAILVTKDSDCKEHTGHIINPRCRVLQYANGE